MKNLGWTALIAFAGGVALLGYSVTVGESQAHLVLLFPVVTGGGAIGLVGMALIFLALFLGFFSFARLPATSTPAGGPAGSTAATPPAPPAKFGGVVFLGPIPIVFGSSPTISKVMLAAAVVMTIILLAFFLLVLA
jgi:uncharacterized protein (TIGR00304 family)